MTEPKPFTFDACADAEACRAGIRVLLAPGKDWSEVHCGRCGRQGIVRHADLAPAPAPVPEAIPARAEAESEVESGVESDSISAPVPAPKGGRS